jgi:hypothetical protein
MRGAVPPLPDTPSWRGAELKTHRDNFTFTYIFPKFRTIVTLASLNFQTSVDVFITSTQNFTSLPPMVH